MTTCLIVLWLAASAAPAGSKESAAAELRRLGYKVDEDGLRRVVSFQDQKLLGLYLRAGVSPNIADAEDVPLLVGAARRGHQAIVEALLAAGANVNARGGTSQTALVEAVEGGRAEVIQALVAAGADVNDATGLFQGTLAYSATSRGDKVTLKALVAAGADLDAADPDGPTPLALAARAGDAGIVQILIDGGADVDKGPPSQSPLDGAVSNGHTEVVKRLVAAGARVGPALLAEARKTGSAALVSALESDRRGSPNKP